MVSKTTDAIHAASPLPTLPALPTLPSGTGTLSLRSDCISVDVCKAALEAAANNVTSWGDDRLRTAGEQMAHLRTVFKQAPAASADVVPQQ